MSEDSKKSTASLVYGVTGVLILAGIGFTFFYTPAEGPGNGIKNSTVNDLSVKENHDRVMAEIVSQRVLVNTEETTYLNLAYQLYKAQQYRESIEANRKALMINPNSSAAWNNICASYNSISEWDSAIAAGEMALKIQPDLTLARNNVAWAHKMKAEGKK